jgi:hypothetical protein
LAPIIFLAVCTGECLEGEVTKENGFYLLHYQWNEHYSNCWTGARLNVHVKGHMKINKDGDVTIERHEVKCSGHPSEYPWG